MLSAHRTFEKVFTSPLVRGQYSPASDDIEVVSWWWLGVPTTWLPPLHHHHTASENITSYTPTPSTSVDYQGIYSWKYLVRKGRKLFIARIVLQEFPENTSLSGQLHP